MYLDIDNPKYKARLVTKGITQEQGVDLVNYCRSNPEPCLYIKSENDKSQIYLILYVDDILITKKDRSVIAELKELGNARPILGMQIEWNIL